MKRIIQTPETKKFERNMDIQKQTLSSSMEKFVTPKDS